MAEPDIRTGMPPVKLLREEFERRYPGTGLVDPGAEIAALQLINASSKRPEQKLASRFVRYG